MDTATLFGALDGVRFFHSRLALTLQGGSYANGRGAIQVMEIEPYAVLSVNLPETEIADDEVWIRTGVNAKTDHVTVKAAVFGLFLFDSINRFQDSGYVKDYAVLWRFKKCMRHGAEVYAVLCLACTREREAAFEAELEKRLAADAVKRLGGRA